MIARAMNTRGDDGLSYSDLARRNARVERKIRVRTLRRLAELVEQDTEIEVELAFRLDDEGKVWITGQTFVNLDLQCQRCAQVVRHALDNAFEMCVVFGEQRADELDDGRNLLVVSAAEITVAEIIEDELLLSLPQSLCTQDACDRLPPLDYPVPLTQGVLPLVGETPAMENGASVVTGESTRPFEGLAKLIAAAERQQSGEEQ